MTDTNLDRAAKMAGFDDWRAMERGAGPWTKDRTKDHAATLDELDAAKAELEAFKREVSDAIVQYCGGPKYVPSEPLARFIIAKPDPLVDAWDEAMNADTYTEDRLSVFRAALAKHGLKVERIEHE